MSRDRSGRGARVDVHAMLLPLWRAVVAYRVVALLYAVVNCARFAQDYARPALGVAVVVVMTAWTGLTSGHYLRRPARWPLADLAVTTLLTLTTLLVETPAHVAAGAPTITSVWTAGAVLAVAVTHGARGGLGAGALSAVVLAVLQRRVSDNLVYDMWLLLVVGLAVGFAADTLRRSARRLQETIAAEAATLERERLARGIHDGVLQVLALVRRRGGDLGLSGEELARLAGEQEVALRRLITAGPVVATGPDTDLGAALGAVLPAYAALAAPAEPVMVPTPTAEVLVAVVREAAANAEAHAGAEAGLWVLVEDAADAVTVSVRDDGPGIPDGRLDEAEADGHLGVASSIRGRVIELGGRAELVTGPGLGTEWEFRVPRAGAKVTT